MDLPGAIDSFSKASAPIHSSAARGREAAACKLPAPPWAQPSASHAGSRCWIPFQDKSRGRLEAEDPPRRAKAGLRSCHCAQQPPLPPLPELLLRCPHPLPRHPNIAVPVLQPRRDYLCCAQLHPTLRAGRGASAQSGSCAALGVRVPATGTRL